MIPAAELRRRCDAARFGFATTAELEPLEGAPGQARASEAIAFGVGMRREGYNLFAMGPEGFGRHLEAQASAQAWRALLAAARPVLVLPE